MKVYMIYGFPTDIRSMLVMELRMEYSAPRNTF